MVFLEPRDVEVWMMKVAKFGLAALCGTLLAGLHLEVNWSQ